MKLLFWLLMLMNVGLFAFFQWGSLLTTADNSAQNHPSFNAEKIKLLDASAVLQKIPVPPAPPPLQPAAEIAAVAAVSAVPATQPSVQTMPAIHSSVQAAAPPPAPAPSTPLLKLSPDEIAPNKISPNQPQPVKAASNVCLEWGEFSGAQRNRANAVLIKLKLSAGLVQRQTNAANSYWVHVPPLASKAAANQKVVQFKKAGVRDIYVVQDAGRWQHAISLGLFKTEEAAHKYHADLRRKGVQSAVVGELVNNIKITTFILKNLNKESVEKIRQLHKDFAGSELKPIVCD